MRARHQNYIWATLLAGIFFLYYGQVASYWVGKEGVDPFIINFLIAPVLLGLVAFAGLRGEMLEKVFFLLVAPIVPCLILGQVSDPAKPGMQWVLLALVQLPYWLGGVAGGMLIFIRRRLMTPNKSTQPTQ